MEQELKRIKPGNKKKIIFLALTIVMFLGISLGAVYFIYYMQDERENTLQTGLVSIQFTDSETINLGSTVPMIDDLGLQNEPYTFTVKNTSKIPINLNLQIEPDNNNTLPTSAIRYGFYVNDKLIEKGNLGSLDENGNFYVYENFKANETLNCKLVFWVDYYYETPGQSFTGKIKVIGESFDIITNFINSSIENSIEKSTCNPTVVEDGITYLSGTNDCVNFNYVWYSGKLWRITAIYPDGSMKMITENPITAMFYGIATEVEKVNFYTDTNNNSYIYQWLNQDFLDTLENKEEIIMMDYEWNTTSSNETTIETKLENISFVSTPVALLNSYEYYMSYKNASASNGYLNIGSYWWLLNPYNNYYVWVVSKLGDDYSLDVGGNLVGVRPTIVLNKNIDILTGNGSINNPYQLKGDKEEIEQNITLLNTRSSGEYVNFDGATYRIVGIENEATKINKVDYVRDESDGVIAKYFASTTTYGLDTNTQSDNYWDYYLNNTWYNSISSNYKSMLEKGTYYLGEVNTNDRRNYKNAVCNSVSSIKTIKECILNNDIVENVWIGYVGLPRHGEMFATQLNINNPFKRIWLITPFSVGNNIMWYLNEDNGVSPLTPHDNLAAVRPSITLSENVKITGGAGTEQSPFEISL